MVRVSGGFSLIELAVAIGVSSLIALGSSSILVSNLNSSQGAKLSADSASVAAEIRNELQNALTRRQQLLGVDDYAGTMTSAGAKENCSGTLFLKDTTSTMLSHVTGGNGGEGTKVRIVLKNSASKVLDTDTDANRTRSGLRSDIRILDAKMLGGRVIETSSTGDTLSADLYITVGSASDLSTGRDHRDIFITRLTFTRNNTTGLASDCDMPLTQANSFKICSEIEGYKFSYITGGCVLLMNARADGLDIMHCPAGQHLINIGTADAACADDTSSADCIDDPTRAGKGFVDGKFNCAAMGSTLDNSPLSPGPPTDYSPPYLVGVSSDCVSLNVAYNNCVSNAPIAGFSPTICTAPPTQNCTQITSLVPTTFMPTYPGSMAPPGSIQCACGIWTRLVGEYCGYCSYNLFRGYGVYSNWFSVDVCTAEGNLMPVVIRGTLTDSNFITPTEANKKALCTGVRQPVTYSAPDYKF